MIDIRRQIIYHSRGGDDEKEMEIRIFEEEADRERWLRQMEKCDWRAGPYLVSLLGEGRFHAMCGESARVLLLTEGNRLASFCTYAEKDDVPDPVRTPWLGFVYTFPEYRGRRLMGRLISRAKEMARENGFDTLWISTREEGLYEKYGAEYVTDMKDRQGEESRIFRMNTYGFYGWENAAVPAVNAEYPGIGSPRDLYNALWHLWTRETCTPRMRADWSGDNRTLGQCAITAFLAQDIFGGSVRGIPLKDGGFHCFNTVGDCLFDLTSEQFGSQALDYSQGVGQDREDHFRKAEKKERYETLRAALKARQAGRE